MKFTAEESLFLYYLVFAFSSIFAYYVGKQCVTTKNTKLVNYDNHVLRIQNTALFAFFLSVLIPVSISTFRYGIGTDYYRYAKIYSLNSFGNLLSFARRDGFTIEIAPLIMYKVSRMIFDSFEGYLFIASLVTYSISFAALKSYSRSINFGLVIFIYLTLYFAPSLNIVEQIMSVSIVLRGLKFIFERRFVSYSIVIGIAMLFHISAIVCILFYFFYFKIRIRVKASIFIAIFIVIALLFDRILLAISNIPLFYKYTRYANEIDFTFRLGYYVLRLPIISLLVISYKRIFISPDTRFYFLIYLFELLSILLGFYSHWAFRIMYYCMISEVILVPRILLSYKRKNRVLVMTGMIVYYMFYFYYVHFLSGHDGIFPYSSFLG